MHITADLIRENKRVHLIHAMVLQYVVVFLCYLICKTLVEQCSLSAHASCCDKHKWSETAILDLSYSIPVFSLLCLLMASL